MSIIEELLKFDENFDKDSPPKKLQLILIRLMLILHVLIPYAYMPLMIAYMEILLRLLCGYPFFAGLPFALLTSFSAGLAISFISFLITNRKASRIVAGVLLGAHGLIFVLQFFMFSAYRTFMSFETIFLGAGNVLTEFTEVFLSAIVTGIPVIIAFFLPLIFFLLITARRRISYTVGIKKVRVRNISVIVGLLIFSILGQAIILAVSEDDMSAHTSEFNFDSSSRRLGLMAGLGLDVRYGLFGNPHSALFVMSDPPPQPQPPVSSAPAHPLPTDRVDIDSEEGPEEPAPAPRVLGPNIRDIDIVTHAANESNTRIKSVHEYVARLRGSWQNEHTGIFEGYNLILITSESMTKQVIDPEMTPTLYRLAHNGFYFSDYYQPTWGGSTSSGEYSILTGLAPVQGVRSIQTAAGQNLSYTIGNKLMNHGYFSASYHNGLHTYYNRINTHTYFGYSTFTAMGNGMEAHVRDVWPASDLEMLQFSLPQYIDQQPFSIYYMMVSGHSPYTRHGNAMSNKNWDAFPEQYGEMSNAIRSYHAANLELEFALEYLVESLELAGIADRTVIVISTDHYPYALEQSEIWRNPRDYLNDLFGFTVRTPAERDHNALIIWAGSLENDHKELAIEISSPTFSLDILPTLLNLFGLEFDSRLTAGRDVFSNADPLVFWLDRSWKTDFGFFHGPSSTFSPNPDADDPDDDEYVSRIRNIVNNRITFSRAALDFDYFDILFHSDGTIRAPD